MSTIEHKPMDHETFILAPSLIVDKARQLASTGLYQQALDLLERNRVEMDVYPTRVEMRLPMEPQHRKQRERMLGDRRMVRTRQRQRKRISSAPPAGL